jgi:uncharacterized membrane protein
VFAISITMLVIEIPRPEGSDFGAPDKLRAARTASAISWSSRPARSTRTCWRF